MKEQYVGDINDYAKFALLRRLSDGGRVRIGVCWMLTAPDDRPDGRKIGYLKEQKRWNRYDPELFEQLKYIAGVETARRLRLIERSNERGDVLPGALFFNEFVPRHPLLRRAFIEVALSELKRAYLIFFDPDNGMEVPSVRKGDTDSPKFVYYDEIAATYDAGHSVLIYQHFAREKRDTFIGRVSAELVKQAPDAKISVYRTPATAFFLVLNPEHKKVLGPLAEAAVESWGFGLH